MIRIFCFVFGSCLLLSACGSNTPSDLSTPEGMYAALRNNPDDTTALYARARYFLQSGKPDSAMIDMQRLIGIDSSRAAYFITMGDIYLSTNRTRYTRQALQKAISLNPESMDAHMKLAELYLYVEMRQDALNSLNEVLKRNKTNPKAYYLKGMVYKEGGDTALAISSFLTASEQDPQYANAYEQLGLLYAAKHDPRCLDFYNNVLKINPKSSLTRYNIGYFHQTHGALDKAVEAYEQLMQVDPQFPLAPYNMGFILFEYQNKPKDALPYFIQAAALKSDYAEAIYMAGLCNEKLGNKDGAILDYREALKRKPGYDLAMLGLERLGEKP